MPKRGKRWFDYPGFLFWRDWYGITFGATGIILMLAGWLMQGFSTIIIGLLSATVGGMVLGKDITVKMLRAKKRPVILSAPISRIAELDLPHGYDGFERISLGEFLALYSREVNRVFRKGLPSVDWQMQKASFRTDAVPEEAKAPGLAKARERGPIKNEFKVRLGSDITLEALRSHDRIVLQKTDYYTAQYTNELVSKQVRFTHDDGEPAGQPFFDGLCLVENNGRLRKLAESSTSNHIGISTLAFTKDGHLLLPLQSRVSHQSAGMLAPSGSGSADLDDLTICGKAFSSFITTAAERELIEECGLVKNKPPSQTLVIGYALLLHRGLKPDFFCVSRLDAQYAQIKVSREERQYIDVIEHRSFQEMSLDGIRAEINRLLDNPRLTIGGANLSLSFPLYLNLLFLDHMLEEDPGAFSMLVNTPPGA
jgi:hypothetical protein